LTESRGCPVVSYYPTDIASGTDLEKARRTHASGTKVLAGLGHQIVRYTDTISARMPDTLELGFFRTAGIVPVMIVSRADQVRLEHHTAAR